MRRKHKRKPRDNARSVDVLDRNPVRIAIARKDIKDFTRDLQIKSFIMEDGEEATDNLADLGKFIGMAAEGERMLNGMTQQLRVLHGALRNVQDMCLAGYAWKTCFDASMTRAVQLARDFILAHPDHASAAMRSAINFEIMIRRHQVKPGTIAGAEIYQEAA